MDISKILTEYATKHRWVEEDKILTNKDIAAINKAYQYYCEEMGWL